MRRPVDWSFDGSWPYEPLWFRTPDGLLHYVDEGPRDGRPIVLVHGNPTWGYLFRRFIPALVAAGHRVIVPDHLGFGRSEKPAAPDVYGVSRHAGRLEDLLDSLDLDGAVLAPHDWGGPISLRWAGRHPNRVAGLFILNTLAHAVGPETLPGGAEKLSLPAPLHLFRTPGLGEVLVQGLDAFKPLMFKVAIERTEALTPSVRRAYRSVHAGWSQRAGMLAFARQVPTRAGGAVNAMNLETEALLARHFGAKPARIVWGEKDLVLPPSMIDTTWLRTLPDADVSRIPEAGHFLQEDSPDRVVPELTGFVDAL